MDFKSHIQAIHNRLEECLATGDKSVVVEELAECLSYAKSLLKVDDYDFWLGQIDLIGIVGFQQDHELDPNGAALR